MISFEFSDNPFADRANRTCPSGVYLLRIDRGETAVTGKLLLLK